MSQAQIITAAEAEEAAARILSSFLLTPASLQSILTLPRFQSYFPAAVRNSPQIPHLYRQLQRQRQKQCEKVERSIEVEASTATRRANAEKRALREREALGGGEAEKGGLDELFYYTGEGKRVRGKELLGTMKEAEAGLERELQELREECAELVKDLETRIGDLSDLIYGKLNSDAEHGMIESLKDLEGICQETMDEVRGAREGPGAKR